MSVLIDGIPMPKDCRDCCFKYESDATDRLVYCYISGCWIIPKDSERAEVCLLKETQPERKTGQWICSDDMYETAVCSVCKWDTVEPWGHIKLWFKFCPHCGAKMEEGEQDG